MASLQEIAELAWNQDYPQGSKAPIKKEAYIATAKAEYAYQMWRMAKEEKNTEGYFTIPSHLLTPATLNVENNEADISGLKILRSLPDDTWLVNLGGIGCDCQYVTRSVNLHQLLCDDDSLGDDIKPVVVMGNRLVFPNGVHNKKLPITYANNGEDVNGNTEIDDAIAGVIRSRLTEIYSKKLPVDVTKNENPNN